MSGESLPGLVLASSSPYRRVLLEKLGLPFVHQSPAVDETPLDGETPAVLVTRLAIAKAKALAAQYPHSLIIGSDQMAIGPDGTALGKPHTAARACAQLLAMSGRRVTFVTGLCLLNAGTGRHQSLCEPFHVHFRELTSAQVERYVEREQPLDCAGSFKSEGLGITLFRAFEGRDLNTLIGLPLMALVDLLANEGISLPS